MNEDDSFMSSWRIPLIITAAIVLVLFVTLLLAQIDNIQRRSILPPKKLPVIDQEATIESEEFNRIYLPTDEQDSETASPTPPIVSATPLSTPITPEVSLLVPACKSTPSEWSEYIVRPGESLSSLAIEFGLSKKTIAQANCLTYDQIIQGQVIFLPLKTSWKFEEVNCGAPSGWIHYVVHPGDTLLKLAKEYNISIFEIMRANCLENTSLSPGRKLFLPQAKSRQS